jgi:hypothetical protein
MPPRKRGAQPSNTNALKHGFYSRQFQQLELAVLPALACWMLFLARAIVTDTPWPWQKTQSQLTPQRVQQSLHPIFALIRNPTRFPKPRGKSPGWPRCRIRIPKPRFAVVNQFSVNE